MSTFEDYRNRYRFIRFERKDRILQITIHRDGGPADWSYHKGGLHDELGDAFFQVGRDPENLVVILTGTGDHFLVDLDRSVKVPGVGTGEFVHRINKEGKDLIHNLLDIDVPVIGAVNGPALIHAELLTLSDLVIASERATFADKAHMVNGGVPGDGVHVWWTMLLGPNRGRQFLLTGEVIGAQDAKTLGFVAEVVPHDKVLARAWEIARDLATKPELTLRNTRLTLTHYIKKRMLDELSHGLQLESLALMDMMARHKS